MSVLSVAVEHWKIYFLAWFLRFIFSLCEWFKCHFSMQLCSEWVEGVLAFWVEMVYMLKPLAPSMWLCVHCSADIEILLSSWWKRGMQYRCLVLLSVVHVTYMWRTCLDWLYILFTLAFRLYIHKMCTRKLSWNVNECLVLNEWMSGFKMYSEKMV